MGFVYSHPVGSDFGIIDAFLDPVCPDSRVSWAPLKQAALIVHPFALPYHDNSFVTSRALHIVDKLNTSITFSLLERFFHCQEEFYNAATFNLPRASVVDSVVKSATGVAGNTYISAIASVFKDNTTDLATRTSFKYGCSRGVLGTPFFFVNGFALPNPGSAVDYKTWRSIMDPLADKRVMTKKQEFVYFFCQSFMLRNYCSRV